MSKFTILLSLTALASNVVLSGSVDHFGNHQILSSGNWKTNMHYKINVGHSKSFGSIFPPILLPSKSLDEVFAQNLLNLAEEDIHQKIANASRLKSTPFSSHAGRDISKIFKSSDNLDKLVKSKFINQPGIPSFHLQKGIVGKGDSRPFQKTSSENINLNTDGHAKRISKTSEFVDSDKYVSFGKPYKSTGTSSTIDPAIQSSISNKPPSFDNLNKTISATKPYKNSDSATSANFKLGETNESIELVNHSGLEVLNKYISFGKPYKAGENFTDDVLKQALENQNTSLNETTEEDKLAKYPDNKYVTIGKPYQNSESSTSIEITELVNHSDQVDMDKYVSFGNPYKNGENTNDDISKLGLESQFVAIDDTTEVNTSVQKTSATVIISFNEGSITGTSRNSTSSSEHISQFDQPIPEGTKDRVHLNTQINFSKINSNVMSVNAHEALGLPIAFQLPIEEHNYLENTEAEISKTKCEPLKGKPLVVCINENSKNISTITFDVPSKDFSMIAALITNALFKNNSNLTDTKALQGIKEDLNVTLTTIGPVVVTYGDNPNIMSAKKVSNFSNDAQPKYLDSKLSDAKRSNAYLNEKHLASNDLIREENLANRFVVEDEKFKGSQINKRDGLLKFEGLINAGNYEFDSNEDGSGEAP